METVSFDQLFTDLADRAMIITTFLALLELIRLRVIKAHQERPLGAIHLALAVAIDDNWISDHLPALHREIE